MPSRAVVASGGQGSPQSCPVLELTDRFGIQVEANAAPQAGGAAVRAPRSRVTAAPERPDLAHQAAVAAAAECVGKPASRAIQQHHCGCQWSRHGGAVEEAAAAGGTGVKLWVLPFPEALDRTWGKGR